MHTESHFQLAWAFLRLAQQYVCLCIPLRFLSPPGQCVEWLSKPTPSLPHEWHLQSPRWPCKLIFFFLLLTPPPPHPSSLRREEEDSIWSDRDLGCLEDHILPDPDALLEDDDALIQREMMLFHPWQTNTISSQTSQIFAFGMMMLPSSGRAGLVLVVMTCYWGMHQMHTNLQVFCHVDRLSLHGFVQCLRRLRKWLICEARVFIYVSGSKSIS